MSIISKINSLITSGNSVTGETRSNLTDVVQDLVDGYGQDINIEALNVTANGEYAAPSGTAYDPVIVNVSASPVLQEKTRTYTPANIQITDVIQPDVGYDGLSAVNVTVNAVTLQSKTASAVPDVTAQTLIINKDNNYDGMDRVTVNISAMPSGTEGTPVASKGPVSNDAIAVTPSVTNSAGYISGGLKTGSPVTVSLSELMPNLASHVRLTMPYTATGSDKYTLNLQPSESCVIFIMLETIPAAPDETEYITLEYFKYFTTYGGNTLSNVLRPAGTIGSDQSAAAFDTATGVLTLGGTYGHYLIGTTYHIYQFIFEED